MSINISADFLTNNRPNWRVIKLLFEKHWLKGNVVQDYGAIYLTHDTNNPAEKVIIDLLLLNSNAA